MIAFRIDKNVINATAIPVKTFISVFDDVFEKNFDNHNEKW